VRCNSLFRLLIEAVTRKVAGPNRVNDLVNTEEVGVINEHRGGAQEYSDMDVSSLDGSPLKAGFHPSFPFRTFATV
jgi:hypothetical protein